MMRSCAVGFILFFLCFAVCSPAVNAEGLSREQGDAILNELRQIRTLLERQPLRPGPMQKAPAAPTPAPPEKVTLRLGGDDALGHDDAPVTIVEYTDFQCSFCARFQADTYPDIRKNFIDKGTVRFIRRDLPMDNHPEAMKAAQAGLCAGDQGKSREMRDLLSENPSVLGTDAYARFARELSLDGTAFKACIDSDRHLADIRGGRQDAVAAGIRGTPSFVIGMARGGMLDGVLIPGALPYAVFEKAIMDILNGNPMEKPRNETKAGRSGD